MDLALSDFVHYSGRKFVIYSPIQYSNLVLYCYITNTTTDVLGYVTEIIIEKYFDIVVKTSTRIFIFSSQVKVLENEYQLHELVCYYLSKICKQQA